MKAFVNLLARYYRRLFAKFGFFQPLVHASFVAYCILLFICGALNLFFPYIGLRNSFGTNYEGNGNGYWGGPKSPLSQLEMGRCVSKGLLESESSGNDPILSRVKAEFSCGCNLPQVYESGEVPNIAVVIYASGTPVSNTTRVTDAIKADRSIQEVIICDDTSNDELLIQWSDLLKDITHFVIRTNKEGRVRCYNRALRMTSAEYMVLMTDNYLPAIGGYNSSTASSHDGPDGWLAQALELFDADPKLGMLSGSVGQLWDQETHEYNSNERDNDYIFGEQNPYIKDSLYIRRIPFLSKRTLKPFMYVECGWIGPLIMRTRANMMIGGLDVDLLLPEGVVVESNWEDCALSYSAWASGWRVGLFDADFANIHSAYTTPPRKGHTKVPPSIHQRFDRLSVRKKVLDLNDNTLTGRYDNNSDTAHNVYN